MNCIECDVRLEDPTAEYGHILAITTDIAGLEGPWCDECYHDVLGSHQSVMADHELYDEYGV